ncbi:hypothetical protein E1301_Tti016091 [Triplophysa tibetana]|uniref:Receptor ligand binding region domain-containing protein n=1 Tax=Triplophysa tibetana TaxID=1572043 RepID=A0A5A9NZS3_9TELE|nr:hypothetical protein E1301_Tti016091 [Triplophysa tibetana]
MGFLHTWLLFTMVKAADPPCKLWGPPNSPQLRRDGDVTIGGIFSFHNSWEEMIITFTSRPEWPKYMEVLLGELAQQNITGLQWIGSESWISDMNIATGKWQHILRGSMGFSIPTAEIRGLAEFLTKLSPSSGVALYKELWENVFGCKIPSQETALSGNICKGNESLINVQNQYTDVTDLQIANNVYKAVYAVAHTLNRTMNCSKWDLNQGGVNKCLDKINNTWQVLTALKEIFFFTGTGEKVYFDENGDPATREIKMLVEELYRQNITGLQWIGSDAWITDDSLADGLGHNLLIGMNGGETVFFDSQGDPPARYELVNLQKVTKGTMEVATIGYYDATQPQGQQFTMNPVNIIWGGGLKSVRASVQINFQIKTC